MINNIFNEDNLLTMTNIPDNYIDGIITSPPYALRMHTKRNDCYYNNGYSELDQISEEDFIKKRIDEFKQFQRIIKDDGVILYNLSYNNGNGILPCLLMSEVHKQTEFTIVDIISWSKKTHLPFQTSPRLLSRKVELIYVIVKKNSVNSFKTNKKVSKINPKTNQKFYKNYTNFVEARNNDGFKTKLKATFSSELVKKLIDIYFPEGSTIYDPFSGIGTTAKGCMMMNCNYIGSELKEEYFQDSKIFLNSNTLQPTL